MTLSAPHIDHRSATRKRTPDWVIYARSGAFVQVLRFSSLADAEAFIKEHTA